MKFLDLFLILCVSVSMIQAQTPVRQQFGTVTTAKFNSIPNFVLPDIYKDRTAHPLPASVNHETDAATKKYMPPLNWCIDGWSCANASAISYCYDYAVQSLTNVSTSTSEPLYTYNYTYHFLNSGNQATGGDGWMFIEAFDIVKQTGCPTSVDMGGFGSDGNGGDVDNLQLWCTGYDKYYTAMKIRADEYYKIDASVASADELIKQIIYDNADGSPAGGLLTFQMDSGDMPTTTISGRRTLTHLSGGGHALTIVGYDDSFQGGSYLVLSGWGDGDYWCPYKLLRSGAGLATSTYGTPVMFVKIKKNYSPKFAFKISLTHSQRNQVCLMTGVANTDTAKSPLKTKDYAGAFNYDGGAIPMLGKSSNGKGGPTIDIGLDLTDFSPDVASGKGTFFLKVLSKGGTGQVNSLSLMDYSGTTVKEIPCSESNKAINGTITMSIPWNGSIVSNSVPQQEQISFHSGNALQATLENGSILFSFPSENILNAKFSIKTLSGKIIYLKALANCFSSISGSESWKMIDNLGKKVCNGAFIASVDVHSKNGISKQYSTKIFIKN